MRPDEFEQVMIALALEGNTDEARNALEECAEGLLMDRLSERMRRYLHDRLREVIDGADPAKALRIARPARKPADFLPEWEMPLAAVAALLSRRRRSPEDIIAAMDEARRITEGKGLSRTQAQRIRKDYKPMRDFDEDLLRHLMLHRRSQRGEPRSAGTVPRFSPEQASKLAALLDRG